MAVVDGRLVDQHYCSAEGLPMFRSKIIFYVLYFGTALGAAFAAHSVLAAIN